MMVRTIADLARLRTRPRRLLAVFPHPDDEAYGVAGALARAGRDPDTAAVLLCLTRGEASIMGRERGLDADGVAALRKERLERVAATVDLDGMLLPGLPDAGLARLDLSAVAAPVLDTLRAFDPQVVVGHDPRGINGHADHIATHWAIRHALETDGVRRRFAMVAYLPEAAEAAKPRLIFPTPETGIDATLVLDAREAEAKEACLRAHEALVTLSRDLAADAGLFWRPAVEHFDILGEDHTPPLTDLFEGLEQD